MRRCCGTERAGAGPAPQHRLARRPAGPGGSTGRGPATTSRAAAGRHQRPGDGRRRVEVRAWRRGARRPSAADAAGSGAAVAATAGRGGRRRPGLRLCRRRRQRPLRLRGAVAGRADRAGERDRAVGLAGARDDDRARRAAVPGAAGQGAGRHRPALGRPPRRGTRAGVLAARLRGRRRPLCGALEALRRGDPDSAGPPRAGAVPARRALLRAAARPRARARPARDPAVGRELGLAGRPGARGPGRRRLAGLRLQHDAGAVRGRARCARVAARRAGPGGRGLPHARWPRCGPG